MRIIKKKSAMKLIFAMVSVWAVLVVKMAIDTSVPALNEPLEKLFFGGHKYKMRRNVGYFVGENRMDKWDFFTHMPNFTEMEMLFDLDTVGEMGEAVNLDRKNLSKRERSKQDSGFSVHAINEYVGNLISVRRTLPDARSQECKDVKYPPDLPATSIIICFYNEAWTSLLRTLHSIIDRTPPRLIHEIILVDDNSTLGYLQEPLEEYISQFPQIKLFRTGKREGLIRARLFGLKQTSPQTSIVTFLDAHIECFKGWLEPMLAPIMKNPRAVTMPVINAIDYMTFRVDSGEGNDVGIFTFPGMRFNWMRIPGREKRRLRSKADPVRSPTMAGGLFTITKSFFNHVGTYDEQMNVWGGENIELSLKTWMCGGEILLVRCSHIAHIFRKRLPYTSGFHVLMRNTARVANVWLDDYKIYFQNYKGNIEPYGDITERIKLREKLQCHSFDWYRRNVFPEMYFFGSGIYFGVIQNVGEPNVCIDSGDGKRNEPIFPYSCNGGDRQRWDYTELFQLRQGSRCLDGDDKIINQACYENNPQSWKYEGRMIQNRFSKKCIGLSKDSKTLELQKCDQRQTQLWNWPKVREPFIEDFFDFV